MYSFGEDQHSGTKVSKEGRILTPKLRRSKRLRLVSMKKEIMLGLVVRL